MHLNIGLGNTLLDQEHRDFLALVTLELNNLTQLFIIYQRAVASEFLLEGLQQLLRVVLLRQTLQRRQRLTTIPLLDTNVDVVVHLSGLLLLLWDFLSHNLFITKVRKRI